ncbi:tobamovirus multiplication 2A [Actinidia rufa]|uniref:Tobamovirus multiplication 2A n=1 Tax=Actinidia rufa TaxID=165716 RepID=A0A7J0H0F1_9ERIC|nr:tobamovirus multiplication 2A [Actinidia rufa]
MFEASLVLLGCWECLLKLLNFLLTLSGLAIVGYGIYLFVEYEKSSSSNLTAAPADDAMIQLGRPMLVAVSLSSSFLDNLPKAWGQLGFGFTAEYVGKGCLVLGEARGLEIYAVVEANQKKNKRLGRSNGMVELNLKKNEWRGCLQGHEPLWTMIDHTSCFHDAIVLIPEHKISSTLFRDIPTDKTGDFDMIYDFLEENWEIVKWVALGVVILEALLFLLAVIVRAANRPVECDSDDEYIGGPRQQARQPLINRPPVPAMGVPVTLDQRPSRNDAWSTRMREKYGLDTTEFTYKPSESNRYQQAPAQPPEERSRCTVM